MIFAKLGIHLLPDSIIWFVKSLKYFLPFHPCVLIMVAKCLLCLIGLRGSSFLSSSFNAFVKYTIQLLSIINYAKTVCLWVFNCIYFYTFSSIVPMTCFIKFRKWISLLHMWLNYILRMVKNGCTALMSSSLRHQDQKNIYFPLSQKHFIYSTSGVHLFQTSFINFIT